MDYQPSYWIIEEYNLDKPKIQPFIIFNSNEERNRFNDYDFSQLFKAIVYYRRDDLWAKKNNLGYYTDTVWPFLTLFKNEVRHQKMKLYAFEHASQPRVVFWLNQDFIPEAYRESRMSNRKREVTEDGRPG